MNMENDGANPDLEETPEVLCTVSHAEAGNAEAQFGMGLRCSLPGPAHDYEQAAQWYLKAADQGHCLAQFNLGQMFSQGHGVTRDDATAATWFGRAADGGDAGAQFNLGNSCHRASMTASGNDAAESRIEAYKWYRLAAEQGYGVSQTSCDSITMRMTREEVTEGNQRATTFAARRGA